MGGLFGSFRAGAHHHDHTLGIRGADIIEQVVLAPGQPGEFIHGLLDDAGGGLVIRVDRLAALEVNVRVLGGAAQLGTVGGQGPVAVFLDEFFIDHRAQVVIGELLDLVDFVRGAEAIEEVQEGHARFEGGGRGNQRHIVGFLD